MIVVRAHRFSRVEIIFRKRQSSGSHRRPRIHKAEQDDVELSITATYKIAPFTENWFHVRAIVKIACPRAITAHELQHQRIHLDGRDFLAAGSERGDYVGSPSRAHDQR